MMYDNSNDFGGLHAVMMQDMQPTAAVAACIFLSLEPCWQKNAAIQVTYSSECCNALANVKYWQ